MKLSIETSDALKLGVCWFLPRPIGWGEGRGEGLPGFYQTSSALGITLQRGRGGGEMPPWVTEGSFFRLHA